MMSSFHVDDLSRVDAAIAQAREAALPKRPNFSVTFRHFEGQSAPYKTVGDEDAGKHRSSYAGAIEAYLASKGNRLVAGSIEVLVRQDEPENCSCCHVPIDECLMTNPYNRQ